MTVLVLLNRSEPFESNRPFSYLQKGLIERFFYAILYSTFDRVPLELLSPLCTFENSAKCSKISFDSDSFQNS